MLCWLFPDAYHPHRAQHQPKSTSIHQNQPKPKRSWHHRAQPSESSMSTSITLHYSVPTNREIGTSAEKTFEVRVSGRRFSHLNRQEFCQRSAYLQQKLKTAEARQSTLIDKIMRVCKDARHWPSPKEITYIWGQNMSIPRSIPRTCGNPLRQLFIDIQIHDKEPFSLPSTDKVPIEYMSDIVLGFVGLARSEGPRREFQQDGMYGDIFKFSCYRREKCRYHQHDDDHPPCS